MRLLEAGNWEQMMVKGLVTLTRSKEEPESLWISLGVPVWVASGYEGRRTYISLDP